MSESPKLFLDGFISKWGGKFGSSIVVGPQLFFSFFFFFFRQPNHQDKVLFQFNSHVMWGNLRFSIQIAEFESKTPHSLFIIWDHPHRSPLTLLHPLSPPTELIAMDSNRTEKIQHSKPISINTTGGYHHRHRSRSVSSDSSDGSPSDPIHTPLNANPPKVTTVSPTSPFLSYIMGQQPGTNKTFPFRRGTIDSIGSIGPVFDDGRSQVHTSKYPHINAQVDDAQESGAAPLRRVHRRATTSWTTASPPQPTNQLTGDRNERASGLLRRLSLSTSFSRVRNLCKLIAISSDSLRYQPQPGYGGNDQTPAAPPNTAFPNSPTNGNAPLNRCNSPPRKPVRRAPSPMGERILKGHFDGFN